MHIIYLKLSTVLLISITMKNCSNIFVITYNIRRLLLANRQCENSGVSINLFLLPWGEKKKKENKCLDVNFKQLSEFEFLHFLFFI